MFHLMLEFGRGVEVLDLGCGLKHAQNLDSNLLAQVPFSGRTVINLSVLALELLAPARAEQVLVLELRGLHHRHKFTESSTDWAVHLELDCSSAFHSLVVPYV